MDTDSFIYCIGTDDIYQDINELLNKLDTSDYSKDNFSNIP